MTSFKRSRILSVGAYVPDTIITNSDFETFLDTSDEWIVTRTGIRERHIVPRGSSVRVSELGTNAARIALERAGIAPEEVDGIICATVTPDTLYPSTACTLQANLGCKNAFAFDLLAACAGFIYSLSLANSMILSGQAKTLLVVGAEILTKTVDWTDRATCILFGDGAGAVVVQGTNEDEGILSSCLGSDGVHGDILTFSPWGENRFMYMQGNDVYKYAVRFITKIGQKAVAAAGLTLADIDLLIPHQANIRIIQAVGEQLHMPPEKVVTNLERYGNTSSASIPLALNEAWGEGRIKKGTRVLFASLGGGLAFAGAVVRF
ncbi:MAG: beta-ketoacyl-ACP synthase III [Chitinispirillaceae bacterium]